MKPARTIAGPPSLAESLLTVTDVAAILKLRPATVRRMVARGEIGFHRLNARDLRFTRADLEGLLARTRVDPRIERA